MVTNTQALTDFSQLVWRHYDMHGRDMPWRRPGADGQYNAYHILVSEVMLQQTQVRRVVPKYAEFLERFPTVGLLARADLADVLKVWNGLGYNRRARYLWLAAQDILKRYDGVFPGTVNELITLPGVGKNTAAAILVYTSGAPEIFVETNIRSVYIHHFFPGETHVTDAQILELVAATLPSTEPSDVNRRWYWALMDYGVFIKTTQGNNIARSAQYRKQTTFQGSVRQVRGEILRLLAERPYSKEQFQMAMNTAHLELALQSLEKDGLVQRRGHEYHL